MLYGEFSFKKKKEKKLGKNCKRYEVSNQASHQSCAKGPHWLMLRGKTSCLLSSQLDQAIDLADF